MEKATFIQCLSNVIIYLLILASLWPLSYKSIEFTDCSFGKKYRYIMILGFIFCLFPFWAGDYINMWRDYKLARQGIDSNWEKIYSTLSNIVPSYTFLRMVLWGTAFIFLNKMIKLFPNNSDRRYLLLFFFAMCLPNFSYLRSAISMAIICYVTLRIVLINESFGRLISFRVFFLLIMLMGSFFFHKSAIFGISVAAGSLISIYFKHEKLLVILFILAIPVFAQYANEWMEGFMNTSTFEESSINIYAAQSYFDDSMDMNRSGMGIIVQNFLSRAQYYLFFVLYLFLVFNGKVKDLPNHVRCFGVFGAVTIAIATLTQYALNVTSTVLFYRILYFSMIPVAVFMAYCYKNNIYLKYCKTTLYFGCCGTLYTLLYSLYNIF